MAWNFRRRVKILPGVHLNFSKKGVSTTFGVRGASITTGKRGTYVNTGIPGTGLYNRQKIGGSKSNKSTNTSIINNYNSSSQSINNNNVDNSKGCLIQGLLVISWIVLVTVILMIFSQSAIWGFVFTAVVVIAKIATKGKKDTDIETTETTDTNDNSNVETFVDKPNSQISNLENNQISKQYFTIVSTEIEKIISLYNQLCKDTIFIQKFKENTNLNIVINGNNVDINQQIKTLFWVDMTRCFIDLGHEINFKNKESFGLFYFFCRTMGIEKFTYDKLYVILNGNLQNSATEFALQIKTAIASNQNIDEVFLLSKILSDYDRDLQQKYLVMLYRYASLAAKADGYVSNTEAEWLSKILDLSKKPSTSGNVIITNDEDQPEKTIQNKPQQRTIKKRGTTQLNALIGLDSVKDEIKTLTNFIKIQQAREAKGLKTSPVSYHCVFTGNPGTGKTTVARIVADIYRSLGILTKGQLVETDRSGLVAEYVGQTAVKTNKVIDTALDGVLFIDEAYSLISQSENDYGKEAIATLLKRMEDNRDRLVVILAGYTNEMKQFIDSNPGLQSRFNRYIEFPDYSANELFQIFEMDAKQYDYSIDNDAEIPLKEYLVKIVTAKDKNFGNARFVRNLFEKTIEKQANRLSKDTNLTEDKLTEIQSIDIPM